MLSKSPLPMVSVSLICYNQKNYIRQALDSALMQETTFEYEIVLSDDKSTDGTELICQEYADKYPNKIRLISREHNIGAVRNYLENYLHCTGKYVAFLEGDDFWIDRYKLQKQVDFLESNPDYVICCSNVERVDEQGNYCGTYLNVEAASIKETSTLHDLCREDIISTPSNMLRNHLIKQIPDWMYDLKGCDWAFDLLNAQFGKIKFIFENLAAYRVTSSGIWSKYSEQEQLDIAAKMVSTLMDKFDRQYQADFQIYLNRIEQCIKHLEKLNSEQDVKNIPKLDTPDIPNVLEATPVIDLADVALIDTKSQFEQVLPNSSQNFCKRGLKRILNKLSRLINADLIGRIASAEQINIALIQRLGNVEQINTGLISRLGNVEHINAALIERLVYLEQRMSSLDFIKLNKLEEVSQQIKHIDFNNFAYIEQEICTKKYTTDLLILDSCYPLKFSGFRFIEYNQYLDAFDNSMVLTTGEDLGFFTSETKSMLEIIQDHENIFPNHENRIKIYHPNVRVSAKLAYVVFLSNTFKFLSFLEKNAIPFVFTLYPGGGFSLNDPISDNKLKQIFQSKYFRKVIVTQLVTRDYLLKHKFCEPSQIEYVYGVVTEEPQNKNVGLNKQRYGVDKKNLDICFVAQKYSKLGKDKGYDVFIESAKILAKKYEGIFFHVVGGFSESDIDISSIKHKIKFYGTQRLEWFESFYQDKDIIIAANVPFVLGKGFFDGFPVTCAVDAMNAGVAAFCSDELHCNEFYTDGIDMAFIRPYVPFVVEKVEFYYKHPELLKSLAENGKQTTAEVYSYQKQIQPRVAAIAAILNTPNNLEKLHVK